MGIINRRRKTFKKVLDELEEFLVNNSVAPCHLFKDRNVLNYLACVPFNNLLHSLSISRVNVDLPEQEKLFVDFILKYKRIRKKRVNFLLDTPPETLYHDSPTIGWRDNHRYEEELNQYRMREEEYEHQKKMIENRREQLWQSPESEVFRYVEKEDRSAQCAQCRGSGRAAAVVNDVSPAAGQIPETACSWCRGTGSSGYTPRISPAQRKLADTFRSKLDDLDIPVFSNFPCKRKPVFLRLTYDCQIFIKH